jgi:small subunit ribosomal protein S21
MPSIKVRDTDSIESALRKFRRACDDAGLQNELRKREYYEKPTWKRVRLRKAAISRTKAAARRSDVTKRERLY